MSHNSKIDNLLKNVEAKCQQAKNNTELLQAVKLLKDFDGEIKYKFGFHTGFAFFCLLIACLNIYYVRQTIPYPDFFHYSIAVVGTIISTSIFLYMFFKNSDLSSLSEYIYQKDTLQDNKLKSLPLENELFNYLKKNFKREFSRGNHNRYFEKAYSSKRSFFREYDFQLFQFHYVNQRIETYTTTDSNGNISIQTRTVYDHYNRYGFVMDFDYFRNIEVKSSGTVVNLKNFNTASIEFDDKFSVGSDSNLNIAKFLTPVVVEAINKLSKKLSGLNLEIDSNGKLCITCDDYSLFVSESTRKYGIEQPNEFYDELAGFTTLDKLEAIFDFMYTLNKQHD